MLREHTLKPDARVNISDMATELDVSIIPMREALARLAAEGLLERSDVGGFKVPGLSVANVTGDFTVIFLLFRHVTDLAFECDRIGTDVLAYVTEQNEKLALLRGDENAITLEAENYVLGLLPMSRSLKLRRCVEAALDSSTIYRRVYYRHMLQFDLYLGARRAYEGALRASDGATARKMVRISQREWETKSRELCRFAWTELFEA